MFASDLFKEITIDAEICFIKLASYKGTRSTGNVITSIGLDESLKDRHVVIIEDIVDTGNTLHQFLPQLHVQQPASLKIAALLHKPDALKYPVKVDYLGFNVPNIFLLGLDLIMMDWAETCLKYTSWLKTKSVSGNIKLSFQINFITFGNFCDLKKLFVYISLCWFVQHASAQFYLRGEIKDEKNQSLQNVKILLSSDKKYLLLRFYRWFWNILPQYHRFPYFNVGRF